MSEYLQLGPQEASPKALGATAVEVGLAADLQPAAPRIKAAIITSLKIFKFFISYSPFEWIHDQG
jgi:hypothetical protein